MQIYIGGYPRRLCLEWSQEYGSLGSLFSPGQRPSSSLPFCLDNGAFKGFKEQEFFVHLEKGLSLEKKPDFIVVPDTPGDSKRTLDMWEKWISRLTSFGVPLALAVQDGMRAIDIPSEAQVIFVGGTTRWKEETIAYWSRYFPNVHVGRVNTWRRLLLCYQSNVKSIDGTGWFRKTAAHWSAKDLLLFLRWQKGLVSCSGFSDWPFVPLAVRKHLLGEKSPDLPLFSTSFCIN